MSGIVLKHTKVDLIHSIQKGNTKEFAELYDSYSAVLFGLISRIVKNKQLAEDILLDTFVQLWNDLKKNNVIESDLFSFMINIAKTKARNASLPTLSAISPEYKQETVIELIYLRGKTCTEVAQEFSVDNLTLQKMARQEMEMVKKGIYNNDYAN